MAPLLLLRHSHEQEAAEEVMLNRSGRGNKRSRGKLEETIEEPMLRAIGALTLVLSLGALLAASPASAAGWQCTYQLTADTAAGQNGTATVRINWIDVFGRLQYKIQTEINGATNTLNTLFTVWVDFKTRAPSGQLAWDYPTAKGVARGVAPAFASNAGVTSGVTPDPNALITGPAGNATLTAVLNYDLLKGDNTLLIPGDAPVVHMNLAIQGANPGNIVGGFWIRQYVDDNVPGPQLVGEEPTVPLLVRATPFGITVVRHPDKITHGHSPGTGSVDHFSAFFGDIPASCPRNNG